MMTQACLKLPDFIMVVPWCHHYVLAITFDAWWTDYKGRSICSWLPVPTSFSRSGLSLLTCFGQWDNSLYDTEQRLGKCLCIWGLSSWCSWNLATKPRLAYWRMRHHVEKKLVVSQPPVSLAAGYSYMCESQPRLISVAPISRTSQFSPI